VFSVSVYLISKKVMSVVVMSVLGDRVGISL
jgi:hypothetical protein